MKNGMTLRELAAKINSIDMERFGDIPVLDADDVPIVDAGIFTDPDTIENFFSFNT